jgi:hypothetical protein
MDPQGGDRRASYLPVTFVSIVNHDIVNHDKVSDIQQRVDGIALFRSVLLCSGATVPATAAGVTERIWELEELVN